jgi:pyruvate ferredoxin oxidoreductase alpha subunit
MTIANRAIGSPINIWNDHSDVMSQRDCGWIQLHAASNQEAADLHVQAFALAEELSVPVMVCMDGFVLTHAHERVDVATAEQVDAFLPPFTPRQVLDPADPMSIGAMVGPDAFMEVRYLQHRRQLDALEAIPLVAERFAAAFGRVSGGLVRAYRAEGADTIVLGLGSVMGTVEDVVDDLRERGHRVGALTVGCFRPWPDAAVRAAVAGHGVGRVVVIDKALAPGMGGVVGADVRLALAGSSIEVYDVVAGLGGRPITSASLRTLLARAELDALEPLTFLDLDRELVAGET